MKLHLFLQIKALISLITGWFYFICIDQESKHVVIWLASQKLKYYIMI